MAEVPQGPVVRYIPQDGGKNGGSIMKNWQHPNWKKKSAEINELCPNCDVIVNYGFEQCSTPEMCNGCGYVHV